MYTHWYMYNTYKYQKKDFEAPKTYPTMDITARERVYEALH